METNDKVGHEKKKSYNEVNGKSGWKKKHECVILSVYFWARQTLWSALTCKGEMMVISPVNWSIAKRSRPLSSRFVKIMEYLGEKKKRSKITVSKRYYLRK